MRWQHVAGARGRGEAGHVGAAVVPCVVPGHGPPSPESVELTGTTDTLGRGRAVAWLACWAVMLGMVVGLGLAGRTETGVGSAGQVPGDGAVAPDGVATVPPVPGSNDARPARFGLVATPGSTRPPRERILILLPAPGEVILGGVVPVAGRLAGPGPLRGVTPATAVHVAVAAGNTTFGEAELPIVGGRFAGWVEVTGPVRGRVVEVRAWDALHRSGAASIQTFVLRARTEIE